MNTFDTRDLVAILVMLEILRNRPYADLVAASPDALGAIATFAFSMGDAMAAARARADAAQATS